MQLRRIPIVAFLISGLAPFGQALSASPLPQQLQPYVGRVVYIDFWASWCGPCASSFPWLNSLRTRYGNRLEVVGVNLDEKRAEAEHFLAIHPAGFPIVYDESGDLADFFHVQGMPSAVILDEHGHVEHQHIGFREDQVESYEAAIRSALGRQSQGSP